jgi:hypothetical protein
VGHADLVVSSLSSIQKNNHLITDATIFGVSFANSVDRLCRLHYQKLGHIVEEALRDSRRAQPCHEITVLQIMQASKNGFGWHKIKPTRNVDNESQSLKEVVAKIQMYRYGSGSGHRK